MKILIIQPYGIGDCLFTTPLIRAIKKQLPVEYIDVILGSRTKEVLENNPNINEIFVIDKDKQRRQGRIKTWFEKRRLYSNLKQRKYDVLIDFSLRKEYARWLKGLKIPKRIGFNHKNRGRYLNYCITLGENGFSGKHVVEFYSDLGKFLGIEVKDRHLEFNIHNSAIQRAKDILRTRAIDEKTKFISLVAGSGSSWGKDAHLRQWPIDKFAKLLEIISSELKFDYIIALGSRQERHIAEKLTALSSKRVINLCGETNLGVSAAIIKMSLFFLGNDGGMAHLAMSLNTPVIAIYGPGDPFVYGLYPPHNKAIALFKAGLKCRPCYSGFRYNNNCLTNECLSSFTPEEAYKGLNEKHFLKNLVM
ncbi:MAG: glycosyltransferase family 9 protein [Candidatus Omnitrophica bacterium]|nr:glycosyltransferase family 9 protein [Candidatus Omnitrophota bacterium]